MKLKDGNTLSLDHPIIMGVLNVTPDSFSDGGRYISLDTAIGHALEMIRDGARIIDVGGESTRPFSEPVTNSEETERVIPVINRLRSLIDDGDVDAIISIDTRKPDVAREALEAGADMINDIYALQGVGMAEVAAEHKVPVVLMHMQGSPEDMQKDPVYEDVVEDIKTFLGERKRFAMELGVVEDRIVLDPGIGFGKTTEHNLIIMKHLHEFTSLGSPVLIGTSNKSFIGNTLDLPVDQRLEGTLATVAISVWNGASIIRVHDVGSARRVVDMTLAMKTAGSSQDRAQNP